MRVVDPHVHLWDVGRVAIPWLDDPGEAYSGDNRQLPRVFTLDTLNAVSGDVDVIKCVHVEAVAADSVIEAQWLQSMAERTGYPLGIVAFADLSKPDFPQQLERLLACDRLRGIRQILNVHTNPVYDYVGRHYMREPAWQRNLDALAEHQLSFDLQIYPDQMPEATRMAVQHPDVTFVLNHTGMFVDRNTVAGWRAWRDGLARLAGCRNVVVKISGLVMFDHCWTLDSFRPYVLETIAAFGVERCMFASNFPVDGLHAGYANLWRAYAEIASGARDDERHALFMGNAERIYRL